MFLFLNYIEEMNFQKFYINNCNCLNNTFASCNTILDNHTIRSNKSLTLNSVKQEISNNLKLIIKENFNYFDEFFSNFNEFLNVTNMDLIYNQKCILTPSNQFNLSIKQNYTNNSKCFYNIFKSDVSFVGLQYIIDLSSINNKFILNNFRISFNNSEYLNNSYSCILISNKTELIQQENHTFPDLIGLIIYFVIFFFIALVSLLIFTFKANTIKNH